MNEYLYNDLTLTILACYYRVYHNRSTRGLTEETASRALVIELKKRGLDIQEQVPIQHHYDNQEIGVGRLDLLVERKVVVELKKLSVLRSKDAAQLKSYLRDGGYAVGLLLNFGSNHPQVKRIFDPVHAPKQFEHTEGDGRKGIQIKAQT